MKIYQDPVFVLGRNTRFRGVDVCMYPADLSILLVDGE